MPLAFPSESHGTVAFGFYNVETDGLLLDRLFFFCTDFCRAVSQLAAFCPAGGRTELPGFRFNRPEEIGDLMGAIQGVSRAGFLGEVYGLWPFPAHPEGFRQKLRGAENRPAVEAALRRRAAPEEIALAAEPDGGPVAVGEYVFSRPGFLDLLAYVWRGGYPSWEGAEEGRRPAWVDPLAAAAQALAGGGGGQALQGVEVQRPAPAGQEGWQVQALQVVVPGAASSGG